MQGLIVILKVKVTGVTRVWLDNEQVTVTEWMPTFVAESVFREMRPEPEIESSDALSAVVVDVSSATLLIVYFRDPQN